jgi:hypothetical protein
MQKQYFRQFQESTGRTVVFDKSANRVTITGADGKVIEALDNPRATFAGYTTETKWSLAQVAYFRSYATWHDLVEPFIFTWPGVEAHEVEPWTENGQTWRVLGVTFPASIDVHSATQLYYFDDAGLLRRMDYQPVVNGNRRVAHYIHSEATFARIVVPTPAVHLPLQRGPDPGPVERLDHAGPQRRQVQLTQLRHTSRPGSDHNYVPNGGHQAIAVGRRREQGDGDGFVKWELAPADLPVAVACKSVTAAAAG